MRIHHLIQLLHTLAVCSCVRAFVPSAKFGTISKPASCSSSQSQLKLQMAKDPSELSSLCDQLNSAIEKCQPEFIKTCKVSVGISPNGNRLGLIASENMKKKDVALAIPYDEQIVFSPDMAPKLVFKGILPDDYDGWTGDSGFLAMLVLNELAKVATDGSAGIPLPKRKAEASSLISAWIASLPSPSEMKLMHPIMWEEENQEILQSSSTKKIYRTLDDMDEDSAWLEEKVWSGDRSKFPESVQLNGETYPCFSSEGFAWALALVNSRSVFVDGSSRLVPIMDMANHDDVGVEEVQNGYMGTFGTTKGVVMKTGSIRKYDKGEEVYVSYGPKSAAEYLLDHGFITNQARSLTVAELTFEIDQDDRFYDDKLDVLEFETYDNAPMEPVQSFDVTSQVGREGDIDPAMIQFLRLLKLSGKDAFLLESIFRKEIWGFMAEPVSEPNERDVFEWIETVCNKALESMEGVGDGKTDESDSDSPSPKSLCNIVRESEYKALSRTVDFVSREKEALDLKEYYQERRLKDLGLDSEWNPDESMGSSDPYADDDLSFGQSRAPGSLDW